jgi:cephalosporin hydroxylase
MTFTPPTIANKENILALYEQKIFQAQGKEKEWLQKAHKLINKAPDSLFQQDFVTFTITEGKYINQSLMIRAQSILIAEQNDLITAEEADYWSGSLIAITNMLIDAAGTNKTLTVDLAKKSITPQ